MAENAITAAPSTAAATGFWRSLRVKLVERAGRGRLVVAPAQHFRVVADAPVAHVVERDLDHELRPQRDPLEVAPLRPARRLAGPALAGLVRRQLGRQLALLLGREAGRVADLAQLALGAVEAEDE